MFPNRGPRVTTTTRRQEPPAIGIHAGKTPVAFDPQARPGLGETPKAFPVIHGICRLDGDDFTIAFVRGGDRPDNFDPANKKIVPMATATLPPNFRK